MGGPRRKPGVLAPFWEGYRAWLAGQGYTPSTIRNMLKTLGQMGRWMQDRELGLAELDQTSIDELMTYRRLAGLSTPEWSSAVKVLEYLMSLGVTPAAPAAPIAPVTELIGVYRDWLTVERGLAATTISRYVRGATLFLRYRGRGADLAGLDGMQVDRFLVAEARRCSVGDTKGRVAELRCFLRFLFVTGRVERMLWAAIPPVAGWRDTTLAPTLSFDTVSLLLASCDRGTVMGARDYAILMLLSRLGLRSIEVVRLCLDDVNWRTGEITVHGKGGRIDTMPLPAEVGAALASYLSEFRPVSGTRQAFLSCRAPIRPLPAAAIRDIVGHACRRAGVAEVGAHRLRHAVATRLIAQGVPILDISQVLRHRDLATTGLYAKVDVEALRAVAKPWPEVTR